MALLLVLPVLLPWTIAQGEAKDMEKIIEMLGEIKESIVNAYELRTGLSRAKISHLMDSESWFNARKAVELGFADKILFGKGEPKEELELSSYSFSRATADHNLVVKLQAELDSFKPLPTTPLNQLRKRLDLLK